MSSIGNNLTQLKKELVTVNLLAVSKYSTIEQIKEAYDCGQRDFGESRLQVLQEKSNYFEQLKDINWHFIGPLQSNKIKKLFTIKNLKYIHSVHNLKTLSLVLKENHFGVKFFLQFNSSSELEKQGFDTKQDLVDAIKLISEANQVGSLCGLMTMAILRSEDWQKGAQECFKATKEMAQDLSNELGLKKLALSMGMSRDYKIAVENGASWVRIGSTIFKSKD